MEAKLVQFKANEKILSDKDFTTLGEKVQNLCLNDDLLENLHQRSKEIEKDACDLVCNYNSLSNHVWTNDCLIIRQINNDFFLFTEKASYTVFIKKINLEGFNDGHMEAIKRITQDEDFKKYEVKNENDEIFFVSYLLRYPVDQKQQ